MEAQSKDKRQMETEQLLRLKDVLQLIPVSKSTWWTGVKSGRFPKPIYLGPRTPCWRDSELSGLTKKGGLK